MLGWVVKLARAIKMCAALHELARTQQRDAHQAMPYHSRGDRPLLFRGRETLRCELANKLTVKLRLVGNPDTIKDREDQQWVFCSISKPFAGFNKRECPLLCLHGFRCSVSFGMHQRVYERGVQLDLLAAQRGNGP